MSTVRKVMVGLTLAMVLTLMSACDKHDPVHTLLISDVSLSGLSNASRLDEVAKQQFVAELGSAQPGDLVSVYAFGAVLTSACPPITADFRKQGNAEEQRALAKSIKTSAPASYEQYVACVRDAANGGSSAAGSPIFGAVVEAAIKAESIRKVDRIVLVTDGCSFGEGANSCGHAMTEPGFADRIVTELPPSLKPDLSGTQVTVIGLGQGTNLSSPAVTALREVFTKYATTTNSTVEFR